MKKQMKKSERAKIVAEDVLAILTVLVLFAAVFSVAFSDMWVGL